MAKTEIALTDKETSILDAITIKKEELAELVKTADSLVVTRETLAEADKCRLKLKNTRLDMSRIFDRNKDKLNKLKKMNTDRENEFIGPKKDGGTDLEAAEDRLTARIATIKQAEEAERQAKLKAEEDRKRAIKATITAIENKVSESRTITDITALNLMIASIEFQEDTFEEFNVDGNAAIKSTVTAIENRIAILEDEKELQARKTAKITSRKEMLVNYPSGYWPTDEQLGAFTQEEFEEAIVHIDAKVKADEADALNTKLQGQLNVFGKESPDELKNRMENQTAVKTPQFVPMSKSSIKMDEQGPFPWRDETISDSPNRKLTFQPTPVLNTFSVNGFQFALDDKIPFDKAVAIREAIEKILSA